MVRIDPLVYATDLLRRDTGADLPAIADYLGIPEGRLVAACSSVAPDGPQSVAATRLRPDWAGIVEAAATLGEVCAVTGNGGCVQQACGFYRTASHRGPVGMVFDGSIDLRLLYPAWAEGFAVREPGPSGTRRSLQFFDAVGHPVHKACLSPGGDVFAFEALAERFAGEGQPASPLARWEWGGAWETGMQEGGVRAPECGPVPDPVTASATDAARVDLGEFRRAWAEMTDAGAFVGLLRRFGLTRVQALRLAGPRFARLVGRGCASFVLEAAASVGLPLKILVGNAGAMQIHAGRVRRVDTCAATVQVRDQDFQLRLDGDTIHSAWTVRKPTREGVMTSLELFDVDGRPIAVLCGGRKPGRREPPAWRELVASLETQPAPGPVG